eukprot:gnl/Hemi2/23839_TR8004_c0_g1_i1.p1 gnl/Hemi2/23839_TR8004_c0_g1~~gnl/Hemi2/23839_TR8004_c0_g1_i1.p1  ORF type:complete len:597 (-),score=98.49 gnl/Hemi2/23839_TR8004_c0_g1_i1:302-2092(-)
MAMDDTLLAVLAIEYLFVAVFVAWVVYRFAQRNTPWYVYSVVWLGWAMSFSLAFLVPIDLASNIDQASGSDPVLLTLWNVVFWSSFFLTWLVYPLLQEYVNSGEFTVMGKFKYSLKSNFYFYMVLSGIFGVFIIYMLATSVLDKSSVISFGVAASNAWGLFLCVVLMGYGLVDMPRSLWQLGDTEGCLMWAEFQARIYSERLMDARLALAEALEEVEDADRQIRQADQLRPFFDIVASKKPADSADVLAAHKRVITRDGNGTTVWNYEALVNLHKRLITAVANVQRCDCKWDELCDTAFYWQDVLQNQDNPEKTFQSSLRTPRQGRWGPCLDLSEWWWACVLETKVMRALAVLLGLMSLAFIWSEGTAWTEQFFGTDMSLISLTIHASKSDSTNSTNMIYQILVLVPMGYMCCCIYASLFKLKLFDYYQMHFNRHTDPASLVFSACYVCRMQAPLCFNFLTLIRASGGTIYSQIMENTDTTKAIGTYMNIAFAVLTVLLCVGTVFNLYSRMLDYCGFKQFLFDAIEDEDLEVGRRHLARERELREKSMGMGADALKSILSTPIPRKPIQLTHIGRSGASKAVHPGGMDSDRFTLSI